MIRTITLFLALVLSTGLYSQNISQEGDSVLNYEDINGYKQGPWIKKYFNGNLKYEAYFVNNKPVGDLKRYDKNGFLYAHLNYSNSGDSATAIFYHKNGKKAVTGFYIGKIKDSIWLYYDNNEKISLQESFKNNLKHGCFKNYTETGFIIEEQNWSEGIKHGPWKKFYTNGDIMWESVFVHGKLEGGVKSYYKSGKIYREGKFKNDLMEGVWKKYKRNGNIDKIYNYSKGISPEADDEQNELLKELDKNKDQIDGPKNSNDINWLKGRSE